MATASSITTDLSTCPICLDLCDNPKSLPCLHTFCLKCLQGLFRDKLPRAEVSCPICRNKFQIPQNGLDGLRHNFVVQQLAEMAQKRESSCEKHKDKQVEFYCHDCKENICVKCLSINHNSHNSVEISEVADSFKLRIDDDDKQILSAISYLREQTDQINQDAVDFIGEMEYVEDIVRMAGDAIKSLVDSQINDVLKKLESVKSESAKEAESVKEEHQLAVVSMESLHTRLRELLDKGRPSDVTRTAGELHNRVTELLK